MTVPRPVKEALSPRSDGLAGNQALSYMLSGAMLGGFTGWGLYAWVGQSWVFIPGLLGGAAVSWYAIWVRYVRVENDAPEPDEEKQ